MMPSNPLSRQGTQRFGIAADHGGFDSKQFLHAHLAAAGYPVKDFGDRLSRPDDDYPDYVVPLASAVALGDLERGVAICGSRVGACITTNKVATLEHAFVKELS